MTNNQKLLCIGSLLGAGILSLIISFFGGFALLWAGIEEKPSPYIWLAFVIAPILAFPLFLLAVGVSRLASFALWVMVLMHWIAMTLLSFPFSGPMNVLRILIFCLFSKSMMSLIVLAALVTFGTHFYQLPLDKRFFMRSGAKYETTD
jgi:hypothetical protein